MRLRVHHLLCVPLFSGHGYSEAFTAHMTRKVEELKKGCEVVLTTGPDEICSACPNLSKDGRSCLQDRDHVKTKDARLLEILELREGVEYDSARLWEQVREKLTKEKFEDSCRNCKWYKLGLCSYEGYLAGVEKLRNEQ
ncbi:MAG: DUF1284 domain-containing protein [Lachnospiraceae bacterium]|nr:DUF1284 domain-containing protein [Lachnospiraceae bacterium]